MNYQKRYTILSLFCAHNPNPTTELIFSSDFELLLSVMLSAQSTDIMVNKITKKLFKIANTPERIIQLGVENLKYCIKSLGLYNIKALNIIKTSIILLNQYDGLVPRTRSKLKKLPGVGRKTTNIILNILCKKNTIAVDTHVFRVCNRTNFVKGKNVKELEKKLLKVVPRIFKNNFHFWFLLHGRYICTARNFICDRCIIYNLCEYKKKYILI